jgi:hypothetical protein
MFKSVSCLLFFVSASALAAVCPAKLELQVSGVKGLDATPSALAAMVESGDNQTPEGYFVAVLKELKKTSEINDTLTLKSETFSECQYKGTKTTAVISNPNSEKPQVVVSAVPVKFTSPEYSCNGRQVKVYGDSKRLTARTVNLVNAKNAPLLVDVLVQIPLGDYGTDGFDQDIKVGSAANMKVTVKP